MADRVTCPKCSHCFDPTAPAKERWGCHCDLETMDPGFEPDGCVLDTGRVDDCVYAKRLSREGKDKAACEYWRKF